MSESLLVKRPTYIGARLYLCISFLVKPFLSHLEWITGWQNGSSTMRTHCLNWGNLSKGLQIQLTCKFFRTTLRFSLFSLLQLPSLVLAQYFRQARMDVWGNFCHLRMTIVWNDLVLREKSKSIYSHVNLKYPYQRLTFRGDLSRDRFIDLSSDTVRHFSVTYNVDIIVWIH